MNNPIKSCPDQSVVVFPRIPRQKTKGTHLIFLLIACMALFSACDGSSDGDTDDAIDVPLNDIDPVDAFQQGSVCGDGTIDDDEECDDGNIRSGDGCSSVCLAESCGDGIVQSNESCDDGNTDDSDGCSSSCLHELCGDGIVQENELCDDGSENTDEYLSDSMASASADPSCSTDCLSMQPYCGDGFLHATYEECDDGNEETGDGCTPQCTSEESPDAGPSDGGTGSDAGTQVDAGDAADAGNAEDGGPGDDAGTPSADAGSPLDSGSMATADGGASDGGTTESDGGAEMAFFDTSSALTLTGGDAIKISGTEADDEFDADIATSGELTLVTWQRAGVSSPGLFYRTVQSGASGTVLGTIETITSVQSAHRPRVVRNAAGGFYIFWLEAQLQGSEYDWVIKAVEVSETGVMGSTTTIPGVHESEEIRHHAIRVVPEGIWVVYSVQEPGAGSIDLEWTLQVVGLTPTLGEREPPANFGSTDDTPFALAEATDTSSGSTEAALAWVQGQRVVWHALSSPLTLPASPLEVTQASDGDAFDVDMRAYKDGWLVSWVGIDSVSARQFSVSPSGEGQLGTTQTLMTGFSRPMISTIFPPQASDTHFMTGTRGMVVLTSYSQTMASSTTDIIHGRFVWPGTLDEQVFGSAVPLKEDAEFITGLAVTDFVPISESSSASTAGIVWEERVGSVADIYFSAISLDGF